MIWWVLLAGLAALLAAPYIAEARRPKMDASARAGAPGDFVTLSRGLTHYRWLGPSGGPIAVCVHGLTTPSFVWGPIAEGLAGMGYRVLLYDLYGRGYSDRPKGAQDAAFFIAQLEELLNSQKVEGKFALLGYSMGGAIAAAFAARHPGRLCHLVLLAPAGMGHDLGPIARLVINHGRLGHWLMMGFYGRSYANALKAERNLPSAVEDITDLQLAELNYRGFRAAVLASMRDMLDEEMEKEHRAIAATDLSVMAIWGREDEVIPIAGRDKLAEWNPAARQVVIDGAEHALAYTHSDAVLAAMGNPADPSELD